MERPSTPPRESRPPTQKTPPTPDQIRRIEENRLRAKALRARREEELRAAGIETSVPRTSAGIIATDSISLTAIPNQRPSKRPHSSLDASTSATATAASATAKDNTQATPAGDLPLTNRDGRKQDPSDALRPAKKFAKFVDYNMSSMTDTKGGFLSAEDDPHNRALGSLAQMRSKERDEAAGGETKPAHMTQKEWERMQLLRSLQRRKAGPFEPGMKALAEEKDRKRCRECGSLEIDFVWEEVFKCCVCNKCKEKIPDKYSLLTKTECREDYLLTDPELRDPDLLPHLSRPNPHKSHWHDMMLFLRYQVEEYAFSSAKWGSAEALDAEFERRVEEKRDRKARKFKEKLNELKRKTRTDAVRRQAGTLAGGGAKGFGDSLGTGGKHVHEWGRTVQGEDGGMIRKCVDCGMEVEELEF